MKSMLFLFSGGTVRRIARPVICLLCASAITSATSAVAGPVAWPQRQRDPENTGRADYTVPANRQGTNFFDALRWQKRAPGSPGEGSLSSSTMVFFDSAGSNGVDLVVSGYHWPKGVQAMDRHTGRLQWAGNPDGGESIGTATPAFSPDGGTLYVVNDATEHPLMAFASSTGPASYWHNGADAHPDWIGTTSPKVTPDGRIFGHNWNDRPHAATDSGTALGVTWSAATEVCDYFSQPAISTVGGQMRVIGAGRCGWAKAFDGTTGDELWSTFADIGTDADPTVDPATGNIYLPAGFASIKIIGLNSTGAPLWTSVAMPVFDWQDGVNHQQRAQSAGCLAHDGQTYYFQTVSQESDGKLYAINTSNGSVRWSYATGSRGWERQMSSPIVTSNGVLVVGNNGGGTYFALRDDGTNATLLATLTVASGGTAYGSATLSPDGLLYLPVRMTWFQSNGDGDAPTQQTENLFNAFDLTANPEITLPPPAAQRGRPLNNAVELRWTPVADPAGQFSHYAIYRATAPFSSVAGLTPLATVSNRLTATCLDTTTINGTAYYYFVTVVTTGGRELTAAVSIGGYRPYDETDLQVVGISRTPRFPRYAAEYTGYEVTEPSGYGPYIFSAATGLGNGQTTNTQRWPATNDPITYTATVRNRGSNLWTNSITGVWQWDGTNVDSAVAGPLAPDALATFTLVRPWDGASHQVRFVITNSDARAVNNTVALDTKSVPFLSYIDESYYESFRRQTTNYPNAVTDDLIDWIQYHMTRFNQMFATAACAKRVHYDVLELLPDGSPDPVVDTMPFGIFPFRFRASEVPYSYRNSGWYNPTDDIDYGYLHEMAHQLGLIDIYQLDLSPEMNLVSGQGYTGPDDLMNACSPFFSPQSALGMSHWLDQAHGYFGQYLYGIPAQVRMRFLSLAGQPLRGATVELYQLEERPGLGKLISNQIKAQGVSDSDGYYLLPNVPIDPAKVPPLPTGDVLHANPFGYVAVIGANGVLHFRIELEGGVDYAWLDITEANIAYYTGQTNLVTFDRHLTLGGPVQWFPPTELTETNAGDWSAWAEGGASGGSTVQDDFVRKQVGATSLKFVTDGGFDTYVRYPATFNARWELASADTLRMRFYAENPNGGFQNASPWIRLKDGDGNYFQYQFYQDGNPIDALNNALGAWWLVEIPLRASDAEDNGWRRTTFGTPDLNNLRCLEIHADTWGYGFTLWIDGVSFAPPLRASLQLAEQGNSVVLAWTASSPALQLEAADEVTGPYLPVAEAPVEAGGTNSLTLPLTGEHRFFRLKMP